MLYDMRACILAHIIPGGAKRPLAKQSMLLKLHEYLPRHLDLHQRLDLLVIAVVHSLPDQPSEGGTRFSILRKHCARYRTIGRR